MLLPQILLPDHGFQPQKGDAGKNILMNNRGSLFSVVQEPQHFLPFEPPGPGSQGADFRKLACALDERAFICGFPQDPAFPAYHGSIPFRESGGQLRPPCLQLTAKNTP